MLQIINTKKASQSPVEPLLSEAECFSRAAMVNMIHLFSLRSGVTKEVDHIQTW